MQLGKSVHEIQIGEKASVTKTFSESDVYQFAALTGDSNPVHTDEEYALQTIFGTRIVHGSLTASLLSAVLGMHLPGLRTIPYSSPCPFRQPLHFGASITATVYA